MQALALEIGFSETTFVLPPEQGGTVRIRIFTPRSELPFAGHPCLGTAWVLASSLQREVIELETQSGIVPVELEREGSGKIVFGRMSQPLPSVEPYPRAGCALAGVEASADPSCPSSATTTACDTHSSRSGRSRRSRRSAPTSAALAELEVMVSCFAGSGRRLEDAHVRSLAGSARRPGDGLGGGPARRAPLPSRPRRVGRVDRDRAGRRDRPALDALRAGRRARRGARARFVGGHAVVVARGEFRL